MEDRDTDEFILVLKGYFKLLMTMNLPIDREGDSLHTDSGKQILTVLRIRIFAIIVIQLPM